MLGAMLAIWIIWIIGWHTNATSTFASCRLTIERQTEKRHEKNGRKNIIQWIIESRMKFSVDLSCDWSLYHIKQLKAQFWFKQLRSQRITLAKYSTYSTPNHSIFSFGKCEEHGNFSCWLYFKFNGRIKLGMGERAKKKFTIKLRKKIIITSANINSHLRTFSYNCMLSKYKSHYQKNSNCSLLDFHHTHQSLYTQTHPIRFKYYEYKQK